MSMKVTALHVNIIGQVVPSKYNGAGQAIEQILINQGIPIDTRTDGPDIQIDGYTPVEVKSRDIDSTSPQDVCKMSAAYIIKTPYRRSRVFNKIQRQYRVKTKNQIIISADIVDFSPVFIQDKLDEAYEICRKKIIAGDTSEYIYGTIWGYLEQTNKKSNSYSFRISNGAMKKLESMANSTYGKLYDE